MWNLKADAIVARLDIKSVASHSTWLCAIVATAANRQARRQWLGRLLQKTDLRICKAN
jgi:hypothetical protein